MNGKSEAGLTCSIIAQPGPAVSAARKRDLLPLRPTVLRSPVVELILRTQLPRCKLSRTLERGCTAGRWGATMGSGGTLVRPDTPCNAPAVVVLSSQDPLCTNPALHPHHQHHHYQHQHHYHHYRRHQLVRCLLCRIILFTKITVCPREKEMRAMSQCK